MAVGLSHRRGHLLHLEHGVHHVWIEHGTALGQIG